MQTDAILVTPISVPWPNRDCYLGVRAASTQVSNPSCTVVKVLEQLSKPRCISYTVRKVLGQISDPRCISHTVGMVLGQGGELHKQVANFSVVTRRSGRHNTSAIHPPQFTSTKYCEEFNEKVQWEYEVLGQFTSAKYCAHVRSQ